MERLIIYLHRNVNNSKFIKKKFPLKFDQHPPLRSTIIFLIAYLLLIYTSAVSTDKHDSL